MRRSTKAVLLVFALALGAGSAPLARSSEPAGTVARVGRRTITADEVIARARLEARAAGRDPRTLSAADLARNLDALVDAEALEQEARRRGLDQDDRVVKRLLMLKVYLTDVATPFGELEPSRSDLEAFETLHARELEGLEGEHRAREVELRWKIEQRARLGDEMSKSARARSRVVFESEALARLGGAR